MRSLSIRLTVESPLAVRSDHAASGAAGVKCIPGSTLLGSLASLYRLRNRDIEAFAPLFLNEQVLYPYLCPASFPNYKAIQDQPSPIYPLPITAASCKRHPGFLHPQDEENDGHGVRDTLFDRALFSIASGNKQARQEGLPLTIIHQKQNRYCHRCGESMDHFEGYYRQNTASPNERFGTKSFTRLQTHTGIHRASGTVQDGILYNRQVFEEGMQFWGEITFPDNPALLKQFQKFADEVGPAGLLRMGTGRSRGMGKVTFNYENATPEQEQNRWAAFRQRLDDFNKKFQDRARSFNLSALSPNYVFALTLHSPLILCDDLLRYQSRIDSDTLQETLTPHTLPGLKLLYHAAAVERITGWQELWGTPRAAEYAIGSGSVFLFGCSASPDENLLQALFALEERGMGKRRPEGFGRLRISDPFHVLVEQEGNQ